jgi:ATP-dependent DNA helicase DinG
MFEQKLELINKLPRPVQTAYAQAITTGLQSQNKISMIQADTGVGKSLAYCYSALEHWSNNPNHRIIISTNTIQLLRELKTHAIPDALKMLNLARNPRVAMLAGAANYVSQKRLSWAVKHISDVKRALYRDELDTLMTWDKEIDLYLDEFAELPLGLRVEQICQTPYEQEAWYQENREAFKDADILLVSHALLVTDILTRGAVLASGDKENPRPTAIIIDEADAFYEVMDSYQEHRLNLLDLTGALRRLPSPHNRLAKKTQALIDEVEKNCPMGTPYSRVTNKTDYEWVQDELKAIRNALSKVDTDDAHQLRHYLGTSRMYAAHRMGYGRTRILGEPDLVFTNPYFTRTFSEYATAQQAVILTSGTLATSPANEHGLTWLKEAFRIDNECIGHIGFFAPEKYGQMSFELAGGDFPRVFKDQYQEQQSKYNESWLDAVSDYIEGITGNTLVLTASHEETQLLIKRLSRTDITDHKRGQKLSSAIKSYKSVGGVFITAAGKAGMDLRASDGRQLLETVIITRLPFQPPQETQQRNLAEFLRQESDVANPDIKASQYYYKKTINGAVRRLRQALGRGIRDQDDVIKIAILDPRFPLFSEINSLKPLKSAIPERFQVSYRQADIVSKQQREVGLW